MVVHQRTCIGCQQVKARENLIRIVRSPISGAVVVDLHGKEKGRGAYICPNLDCIDKAIQPQRLNRAFRIAPGSADRTCTEIVTRLKQELSELAVLMRKKDE